MPLVYTGVSDVEMNGPTPVTIPRVHKVVMQKLVETQANTVAIFFLLILVNEGIILENASMVLRLAMTGAE